MATRNVVLRAITVVQRDDLAGESCAVCKMHAHPLYGLRLQWDTHGDTHARYMVYGCAICIDIIAKGVQMGWPNLGIHTSRVYAEGNEWGATAGIEPGQIEEAKR